MGRKGVGLVAVVIAVIVAIGLVVAQSSAPGATTKTNDTFQLDLVIQTGGPVPDILNRSIPLEL